MGEVAYKLDKNGDFIIENYNKTKAFSSFFPGIAGLRGIPLWLFYVNRGQCISSFGVKDKDSSILEFLPANQAYNLTAVKGFRTFLKIKKAGQSIFYEPFKEANNRLAGDVSTKMIINPSKLEIEEINRSLGLKVNITYITIPNEPFAGMLRRLIVTNIARNRLDAELVDGLPQIVPFGMSEWHQKHMSRTIEAWMRVSNLDNNAPFYTLKVDPRDRPELEYVDRGNFYAGCETGKSGVKILRPIVDPDTVFGKDGDISYPALFAENEHFIFPKKQKTECKTSSAFVYKRFNIAASGDKKIISIIGNAGDIKCLNSIVRGLKNADYFERKLSENEEIINKLQNNIFTKSSSNEFDFYSRQTFLDNLLRGGFPISIDNRKKPFVFYAYARKHGDLERDYNAFLLQPSYYSQGNGAYRDINQNRRNDNLFNSDVKYDNILTFVNAIQSDGFNPHLIEGISLSVRNSKALDAVLKKHVKKPSDRKKTRTFLINAFTPLDSIPLDNKHLTGFTPGSLIIFLEERHILSKDNADKFLKDVLEVGVKKDVILPGEGYWVDHWTYNIDLFENYLSCYPEELKKLFLDRKDFTFYDTYMRVNPRSEKYVYVNGKIRQFGSVTEDEQKKRVIEKRTGGCRKARMDYGRGRPYKTSLLVKLACVIANKMASLDPFGMGIEMEAGKPGWCDSLNSLPGIFGSSLCETFELKRLILFIKSFLPRLRLDSSYKILLPSELADFLSGLHKLTVQNLSSKSKKKDFRYWDASCEIKEYYREKVWHGFNGKEKPLSIKEIEIILEGFLLKLENGLKKALNKKTKIPYTYYINEVKKFHFNYEKGKRKLSKDGFPTVKSTAFSHKPLSLFLEGPMHAMRVIDSREKAQFLYRAVRKSELYDKKLRMYKINAPLGDMPAEIGRSVIFTPGWLENESIWLHMEYKYMLEVLRKGLYEEFFLDLKNCLVAFQEPSRYGRSILENSSFIASSAYPDKSLHGNGFVARLTGSTTEFLSMWLLMCLGKRPFLIDGEGRLSFELKPALPGWLFTKEESFSCFYFQGSRKKIVKLPGGVFAFCLLGKTLVVYHNYKRRDTFGRSAARPKSIILKKKNKTGLEFTGNRVPPPYAQKVREGFYDRIDVKLS
ncbi:MAG: hypothetical protein U9R52_00860 [Candidatus Omnitrophota bacterium]|nr:hypothetical protein [Candidatus Omnitrophota bacterium]